MGARLLRIGKRPAAWETRDPEQILASDFTRRDGALDLELSVYELSSAEAVDLRGAALRIQVEHAASFLRPPRKAAPLLDVTGVEVAIRATPGTTAFAYSNEAHRELLLADSHALRGLVDLVVAEIETRAIRFSLAEMLGYVRSHTDSDEWRAAASARETVGAWVHEAKKRPAGAKP